MIGNGLMNYDFNAGNGNPAFDLFVDKLDGLLITISFIIISKEPRPQDSHKQEKPHLKSPFKVSAWSI